MKHLLIKTTILTFIPAVAKAISTWFESLFNDINTPKLPFMDAKDITPHKRKTKDMTEVTQVMIDYIIWEHDQWKKHNKKFKRVDRTSMQTLVDGINLTLGTNKSIPAISKFWRNDYDQTKIKPGVKYFGYKDHR